MNDAHTTQDVVWLHRAKLGVSNGRTFPRTVFVEPWAEDFTLLPGENLEVVAFSNAGWPWFYIDERDDGILIYCNDTEDFKVFQGDLELTGGHQRPW
jgi:hypothetical protein